MVSDTPVSDPFPNLLPNAMITPVPVSNERGTNLTNLTSLKVQNAKGGLGPSPKTHENNKSQNELVYLHITHVLLDANRDCKNYDRYNYTRHLLGHALKQHASTLSGLLDLIRTPALIVGLRWKNLNDGNKEEMFDEEVYEDLFALYPFLCMLQNKHGPIADGLFDIFATTRVQFEHFITEGGFKVYAPILYDEDTALISQQQRISGLGQDGNRTTTPVHDIKLWAARFNPITEDIVTEDIIQCTSELYWDEINWPPLLCWDEYFIDYINRVLSQDLSTVYKNNNPPEHSLDIIATTKNKESRTELVNTTSPNVKDKGEDKFNGGLNGTNGGEGSGGGISTAREDIVINPATNKINYYGEAMEGRINVVDGKGEEVKLFGGGSSEPDSGLESSDTNISGAEDDIATKIAAADKCRNAKDPDLDIIRKVIRKDEKSTRRDIAMRFTGSRRLYHKAVPKIQPSVVIIQSYARMFFARRKVISMRGGVYRRTHANGIKRESATSPVRSYTKQGTRRIHSQASELFQSSSLVTLLEKNDGYNGEMGNAWNFVDPSISFSTNVFAIHTSNQGPLPFPKALWTLGEESGCTRHVRLEGEYVEKVVLDRGAWGEYDDNPIDVRDLKRIMIDLWKFTGQVSTVYNMYTLVSITLVYIVMVGGMTFDVFNPKTGVVLYRLDVRTIGDELRANLQPKVDYHNDNDSLPDPRWVVETIVISVRDPQVTPSYVYRWGESTNLICFAMFNNSLINTPRAVSDILLSPCSRSKCAGIICILLHQWKGQPTRYIGKTLELHRHKEDIIWGAYEHDGRSQLSVVDTTGTQTYAMDINSNNSIGIIIDYDSGTIDTSYRRYVNDTIGTSYLRQSKTTTNSACTENNSPNMRTIASYTTRQIVQTSYGTSLIVNDSINQRSDTGRSIHVNGGAATDVIIMDGHVLVTSGTDTQQHRHCSTIIIGSMLLLHKYIHPTDMKSITRLFDYGEIPTSDDIDISTDTDSNIDGYRSISTRHGTSSIRIGYDMDNPNSVSVSNGWHHVALINDDRIGESRMMGASYKGSNRGVSNNMSTFTFEDPLNYNDNDEDQGNSDSSDEYISDVSINTHDISRSTHLTSTTDNNMDTAGFTMSHGLNHGIVHTHGHYNDTTIGRFGYYKDTTNQYDCMRIRVTFYDGSKDQGPTILIQVLRLRLVRPRMTGE